MAFIYLTVGKKGAGKSLRESRQAIRVMNGYYASEKKYPDLPRRIYFSKQKFAKRIEDIELWDLEKNPHGHLYYWDNVYQLKNCPRYACWKGDAPHPLHNADVFWDEIGNDITQTNWASTPDWTKQIFSHARKRGVRIFANTQKYEMVDINFRRQVDEAVWLIKLFGSRDIDVTRPNPRFIFVFQMSTKFDPMDMENENDPRNLWELREGWPSFAWYGKRDVSVFDTTSEVPPWIANKTQEISYECVLGDECTDPKHRAYVKHVPL